MGAFGEDSKRVLLALARNRRAWRGKIMSIAALSIYVRMYALASAFRLFV